MTLVTSTTTNTAFEPAPDTRRDALDFSDAEAYAIGRIAQLRGWQVAAHDYMRSTNQRAYRLAVDEYSAQVRFLLPLTPESRVLQMRSGWGSMALNLAACAGTVVALDDRPDRLRFLTSRLQDADASLEVVCSSPNSGLPFADNEFDAILVFDLLENIQGGNGTFWQQNQEKLLAEVHRVLRPGGSLLLGTPNRIGLVRVGTGRQHLLGLWGHRWALRRTGFTRIRFYAPLPSHLEPFFILPLEQPRLFSHFVDWMFTAQDYRSKLQARGMGSAYKLAWNLWRAGRHLGLAALAKYVVPSYLILSEKSGAEDAA